VITGNARQWRGHSCLVTLSYVFSQHYSEIAPSDPSFKKLK
jgi:hypothetical protein